MPPVAWCTLHHVLCVSRCRVLHPLRRTLHTRGAGTLCESSSVRRRLRAADSTRYFPRQHRCIAASLELQHRCAGVRCLADAPVHDYFEVFDFGSGCVCCR
jgi:hypothetical protein